MVGPLWAAAVVVSLTLAARAEVTVFQQGLAPSAEYRGCVDTYIVGYGWAHDRPSRRPTSPTLRPAALMRFDISAIDKTHRVERALLRLYFASIPPQGFAIEVRTLKRPWDVTATWYEYKYKDAKKSNENNWSKFGGDLDESDFGQGAPGLVADYLLGMAHPGLQAGAAGGALQGRPTRRGGRKARTAPRNSNCHYRTGHRCGYAKQDPRYPGNWGWTPRLRAGGTAGDFNHALFYFDLSAIPKTAAVRRAVLRAFVDLGNMRIPPEALPQGPERPDPRRRRRMLARCRQRAKSLCGYSFGLFRILGEGEAPGWSEHAFDFNHAAAGKAWQGGTLASATAPEPVAVCHVGQQWNKTLAEKDRLPETWLEWDLTGLVQAAHGRQRGVVLG
ncbi:MAG: hypothetical protein B1H04_01265 [Planctomycetales bacterium 4484_123]|nr:MAG: hypothetical protein B1H04_01265 [Planctomycetales bacterium 4484_123]